VLGYDNLAAGGQQKTLAVVWQGYEQLTRRVLDIHSAENRDALLCQPLWTVLKVWPDFTETGRTTLGIYSIV